MVSFFPTFKTLYKVTLLDLKIDNMTVRAGLPMIFAEASDFAQRHSLQLHMMQLTRTILGYENSWSYPTVFLGLSWFPCFVCFFGGRDFHIDVLYG